MSPRVERIGENVTIILGDCREVLPALNGHNLFSNATPEISCVITDPPYGSGGFTESAKKSAKGMGLRSETIREQGWFAGDAMTTAGMCWLMAHVAGWCYPLLPEGGTLSAFTDWRMVAHLAPAMESARMRFQNLIVWDKGHAGLGTGFRAQHELALHFAKGTPKYHSVSFGNVLTVPRVSARDREHQTEKPVNLLRSMIEVQAAPGGIVLDPFAGSGSTGVAAIEAGRGFIGCEIEERYFDTACRRLEAAWRAGPHTLANTAEPIGTQSDIFEGGAHAEA